MRCCGQYNGVIAANMAPSLSCRLLVAIIREAQNPTVLAVAAHDLGEYVRYYPRGKKSVNESSPVVCVLKHFSLLPPSLALSLSLSSFPLLLSLPPSLPLPSLSPLPLCLSPPSLLFLSPSLSLSSFPPSLPPSFPLSSPPLSLPSLSLCLSPLPLSLSLSLSLSPPSLSLFLSSLPPSGLLIRWELRS